MRILLLIFILLLSFSLSAQNTLVVKARKVFLNGYKVKNRDTLTYQNHVVIKPKGKLELSGKSTKNLILNEGAYKIQEEYDKHLKRYQHHDSIYNVLLSKGLANCNFPYEVIMLTHNAHSYADDIKIQRDSSVSEEWRGSYFSFVNVKEKTSIQINWTNPDSNYNGKYIIIVEDIFEDYKELLETKNSYYYFDLTPYISEVLTPILIFTIIAEDCRESYPTALGLTSK